MPRAPACVAWQAVAELLMEKEKINADDVQKLIGVMRARPPAAPPAAT